MFTGYSDKTVDFFWDIRFNNSREWFHPRKDQFNEYIMTPTKELSGELLRLADGKRSPAAPESSYLEDLPRRKAAIWPGTLKRSHLVLVPE